MADNTDGDDQPQDAFGRITDDVLKGTSAVKAVGSLVGQAAQPLWDYHMQQQAERERERKLELKLGEWAHDAKKNGRWHQPMLSLKKFEDHRDLKKGYFTPSGECTSTFGWARLLYALDIRPGQEIIDWKLPTSDANLVDTGEIYLEMPAEVLWHIINLYRLYSEADPRDSKGKDQTNFRCRLPFGNLYVKKVNDKVVTEFESRIPTTSGTNGITNMPFCCDQYSPGGKRLLFPQDQVINNYYLALSIGTSRLDLKFSDFNFPEDRSKELVERAKELVSRLKALRSSTSKTPYLLTPEWLEQASRIYRRITTDAGEYTAITGDIVSAMKTKQLIVQSIEALFTQNGERDWEGKARIILRARQLLPGQNIRHVWKLNVPSPSTREAFLSQILDQELPSILTSFSDTPKGSLTHILSTVQDEACYLLTAGPEIRNTPGIILEFTPAHELWNFDCVVK
jgi:hypothetical protein